MNTIYEDSCLDIGELPPVAPKSPVELQRLPKFAVVRLGALGGGALSGWTDTPLPGEGLGAGDAELLLGLSEWSDVVD